MRWIFSIIFVFFSTNCIADPLLKGIDKSFNGISSEKLRDIEDKISNSGITVSNGPEDIVGPVAAPEPNILICPDGKPVVGSACIESTPIEQAQNRFGESLDPRIVGGEPASIEEYPWQVVLIVGDTPAEIRVPFCGGSIVGYQWILTAAHCLSGISNPKDVDIVSGSTYPKFPGQGSRVKVSAIHVHKDYNPVTFEHDIALLKLKTPVGKGKRIALAGAQVTIPSGTFATVSGWGAVTAYGPMVDRLLRAKIPVVDNSECSQAESYGDAIKSGMLCAGKREGGLDACQGDSGGPFVANIAGKATQIGVVSWGKGCALRLKYGVYTRVSSYAGWLSDTMSTKVAAKR